MTWSRGPMAGWSSSLPTFRATASRRRWWPRWSRSRSPRRSERYDRPADILGGINRTLTGTFDRAYITACCVSIDRARETMVYAAAGHPAALLRRSDGRIERLDKGGIVLTLFPAATYATRRFRSTRETGCCSSRMACSRRRAGTATSSSVTPNWLASSLACRSRRMCRRPCSVRTGTGLEKALRYRMTSRWWRWSVCPDRIASLLASAGAGGRHEPAAHTSQSRVSPERNIMKLSGTIVTASILAAALATAYAQERRGVWPPPLQPASDTSPVLSPDASMKTMILAARLSPRARRERADDPGPGLHRLGCRRPDVGDRDARLHDRHPGEPGARAARPRRRARGHQQATAGWTSGPSSPTAWCCRAP